MPHKPPQAGQGGPPPSFTHLSPIGGFRGEPPDRIPPGVKGARPLDPLRPGIVPIALHFITVHPYPNSQISPHFRALGVEGGIAPF